MIVCRNCTFQFSEVSSQIHIQAGTFNQSSPGSQVNVTLSVPRWAGPGDLPQLSAYVHTVNVPTAAVWSDDSKQVVVTIDKDALAAAVSAGSAYTVAYYAEGWGFASRNSTATYSYLEKASVLAALTNVSDSAGVLA